MCLLRIEKLKVEFLSPSGQVQAVDRATFELRKSETLALAGETGSGKSTIAHSILNLLPENAAVHGKIIYKDKDLLHLHDKDLAQLRGREISLVIQNPALALNPVYSIGHQITEPLIVHRNFKKKDAILVAKDLLKKLRFKGPDRAIKAYPFEISGGMKQRVLIGISVILNPNIIIADEPTKGLDSRLRDMVLAELNLVREMDHSSLILITHDLNVARETPDGMQGILYGEM